MNMKKTFALWLLGASLVGRHRDGGIRAEHDDNPERRHWSQRRSISAPPK